MTSYQTLLVIILGFWTIWFVLCLVFKRSWIPVIPFVPLIALGVGWGLNHLHEWAGTIVVGAAHLFIIFTMGKAVFAKR